MSANLFDILPFDDIIESFKGSLWKYALAGRICYSSDPPQKLLEDEKVRNESKTIEYLTKLASMGHTSVFAHERAVVFLDRVNNHTKMQLISYAAERFKAKVNFKDNIFIYSYRHVIEDAIAKGKDFVEKVIQDTGSSAPIYAVMTTTSTGAEIIYVGSNKYQQGFTFILSKVSRVLTHQLVRHTMLDFNQKSDRYTDNSESNVVIPADPDVHVCTYPIYKVAVDTAFSAYRQLRERDVKKQDARYILPNGLHTTIMVSGDREGFKHFFSLRTDKKAQEEIRLVAVKMWFLLKDFANIKL